MEVGDATRQSETMRHLATTSTYVDDVAWTSTRYRCDMSYEVIKTINGRQYRYLQRSVRVNGRVKTESVYLGPVEPKRDLLHRLLDPFVKSPMIGRWGDEAGVANQQAKERAGIDRNNSLLSADSISLNAIAEVAASQSEKVGESDASSSGDNGDGSSAAGEGGV